MCLALPARVMALLEGQRARVNIGGIEKEVSTALLDCVAEGDYVILHVGFALTKLDEEEAKKTLRLFAAMSQGAN
jgi:hydrogenase expression/formation protein HypC